MQDKDTDSDNYSRRKLLQTAGIATTSGVVGVSASSDTAKAGRWTSNQPHPSIPGLKYTGSIQAKNICYWADSSCKYAVLKTLVDFLPGDEQLVAGLCGAGIAGCTVFDNIRRLTGCDNGWVHTYIPRWWSRPILSLISVQTVLLPQGIYGSCW